MATEKKVSSSALPSHPITPPNPSPRPTDSPRSSPEKDTDAPLSPDPATSDDKKVTSRLPGHGWSSDIKDYIFIKRVGARTNKNQRIKFYGSCAAVYRARLTDTARERAKANGASSLSHGEFALKVVYNEVNASTSYDDLVADAQIELDAFRRLPRHANIVRIDHYFTGHVPTGSATPPDWIADETNSGNALFIVMELCHLSLQEVISYRKGLTVDAITKLPSGTSSLFQPNEILLVAAHISSALILLGKELIAHRDVKPENILIRLPSDGSITIEQALMNIWQTGLVLTLADFGSLSDFTVNECKEMKMLFPVGLPRGGAAHTIAPEIALPPRNKPVVLNYSKADVWSLGVVLATMMTTGKFLGPLSTPPKATGIMDPNTKVMVDGALAHITSDSNDDIIRCLKLVNQIVVFIPDDRSSCIDVHGAAHQALPPFTSSASAHPMIGRSSQ